MSQPLRFEAQVWHLLGRHRCTFKRHQYVPTHAKPNIYIAPTCTDNIKIAKTISNFIITAASEDAIDNFEQVLAWKYLVNDLDTPTNALGWTINRPKPSQISLLQPNLVIQLLKLTGLTTANPGEYPLPKRPDFEDNANKAPLKGSQTITFQSAVGALCYPPDCTRHDISFPTGCMARLPPNRQSLTWTSLNLYLDTCIERVTTESCTKGRN